MHSPGPVEQHHDARAAPRLPMLARQISVAPPSLDRLSPVVVKRRLSWKLPKPDDSSWLPFVRAFVIGYASDTAPPALGLLIGLLAANPNTGAVQRVKGTLIKLARILMRGFHPRASGMACGVAMGGARWGQDAIRPLAEAVVRCARTPRSIARIIIFRLKGPGDQPPDLEQQKHTTAVELSAREVRTVDRLATWSAATLSSLLAIVLLQSAHVAQPVRSSRGPAATPYPDVIPPLSPPAVPQTSLVARLQPPSALQNTPPATVPRPPGTQRAQSPTLDLTLFFLVRALDTLLRAAHTRYAPRSLKWLSSWGDVLLFQLCCWRIMFCWFYLPDRLPPTYVKWISTLAAMDSRLIFLLQQARLGVWTYRGKIPEEVQSATDRIMTALGGARGDLDLAKADRIPCWVAHGKVGASAYCSVNAARRWAKAWAQSMGIYFPVFAVPAILFRRRQLLRYPMTSLFYIVRGASRSSAFLATFVAANWSGVCLARTTLLPRLFPSVPQIYWDSGFAPQLGSFLSGFSVLIENKRRRGEMALYVAPRALYAIMDEVVPTAWKREKGRIAAKWVERLLFAASTGVVTAATVHHPDHVRGVVKGVMGFAVGPEWQQAAAMRRLPSDPPRCA